MTTTVKPFLMFEGTAAEAAEVYAGLFEDASFQVVDNYPDGAPMLLSVTLAGQEVMLLDSQFPDDFAMSPTFSMSVRVDSTEEVDRLYAALADGGRVLMPLDSYPFNERYFWLTDRFGLSWQVGLAG